MNSKLYVPDPNQWIRYFEKKPSDNLKVDNSTIKLTSPVQSVVQRAKSELERINRDTDVKPVIITSTANKSRIKSMKTLKQKRPKKTNFTTKIKRTKCKNNNIKINNKILKKKNRNKNQNKKATTEKRNVVLKDIFG